MLVSRPSASGLSVSGQSAPRSRTILRSSSLGAALILLSTLAACGGDVAETPATEAAEPAATPKPAPPPAEVTRMPSPEGARVFFITPDDGDTVQNPIRVEFGVEGMDIVRAGHEQPNSGHHHLIIDSALPNLDAPIPADDRHIHFGDASTSTELTLEPGEHTLQLLLGDHLHIPHDPPVISRSITIDVE